jgi:hypothetical protein
MEPTPQKVHICGTLDLEAQPSKKDKILLLSCLLQLGAYPFHASPLSQKNISPFTVCCSVHMRPSFIVLETTLTLEIFGSTFAPQTLVLINLFVAGV